MQIRPATAADADAIAAIWNPIIRDTAITFWPTERSGDEITQMIKARHAAGHVFLQGAMLGAVQIAVCTGFDAVLVWGAAGAARVPGERPGWMAAQRWLLGGALAALLFVELSLRELIGPAAGRLHTARSRNDIDHTLFKLALKTRIDTLLALPL